MAKTVNGERADVAGISERLPLASQEEALARVRDFLGDDQSDLTADIIEAMAQLLWNEQCARGADAESAERIRAASAELVEVLQRWMVAGEPEPEVALEATRRKRRRPGDPPHPLPPNKPRRQAQINRRRVLLVKFWTNELGKI